MSDIRVAIIGSRDYEKLNAKKKYIKHIINVLLKVYKAIYIKRLNNDEVDKYIVVSGGARGIDTVAKEYVQENNLDLIEYLPDWDKYGKKVGYLRNKEIVDN